MKRFFTSFAALTLATLATVSTADAQVTASSSSTGGTAISSARGFGNTRLNSSAHAMNGGYARSTLTGSGVNGGFASGNSRAFSNGGVAISNGNSQANGWGARSHVNSYAGTVGGFARSNGNAIANGNWANATANANTRTWGTYGSSSAEAIDNRPSTGYPVVSPGQPFGAGYATPYSQSGSIGNGFQSMQPTTTAVPASGGFRSTGRIFNSTGGVSTRVFQNSTPRGTVFGTRTFGRRR